MTKIEKFVIDNSIHEYAIEHAALKGLDCGVLTTFSRPEAWETIANMIDNGKFRFKPPTEMYIDKLSGDWMTYEQAEKRNFKEVRKIAVLETLDRVICNCFYRMYYDEFHNRIHKNCVSYRRGLSAGKTVKQLVAEMNQKKWFKGYKLDLSKFFDTVNRETLDATLDVITPNKDCIDKVVIDHYHDDCIIIDRIPEKKYKSLSQGNPIACLLADICLYDIDNEISEMQVIYYRYSDDIIILGPDADNALARIKEMLVPKGVSLNPKKVKPIIGNREWFEFLGFKIKGDLITMSAKTVHNIERHIKEETLIWSRINKRPATIAEVKKACRHIQKWLYLAYEENSNQFGLCQYLFGTINVKTDIDRIDTYIKDCLRAMYTGKNIVYGLGSVDDRKDYTIPFQTGQNVGANYRKTHTDNWDLIRETPWRSLWHMYKVYHTDHDLWMSEINEIKRGVPHDKCA